MPTPPIDLLRVPAVRLALRHAWLNSKPGTSSAREEGGFIVRGQSGEISVEQWPAGAQNSIQVPEHSNCKLGAADILGSLHTHPNTGIEFIQAPSETDRRSVRDDVNLKGVDDTGEFVISRATIYLVTPAGAVSELGNTSELLDLAEGR